MTDQPIIEGAFERAEAAFERAIAQSLRAQQADFQKLAQTMLAEFAALAIEQILSGVAGAQASEPSPSTVSAAIARAAASGGRFL